MKVITVSPRGFCKGVYQAILLAKKTAVENPTEKITILGPIVHNRYVVEALKYYNINTIQNHNQTRLQMLEEISEGIVIFTAHGISNQVQIAAKKKGLKTIDATCVDVLSTHSLIKQALEDHYTVFYIGKRNHPEALAIFDNFPSVKPIFDQNSIPVGVLGPIMITNQTTLSKYDLDQLIHLILKQYPKAVVQKELCSATRVRQEAIENLKNIDGLIVVGDPLSNNTQMLAKIGLQNNISWVQRIESIEELDPSMFKEECVIAITAGASTPSSLTQQVIEYCTNYDFKNPAALPKVNIENILD